MRPLREGLLNGRAIALARGVSDTVRDSLTELGASVVDLPEAEGAEPVVVELDGIVYDARLAFADGGGEHLRAALENGWAAVRAVAVDVLIAQRRPGKIVLIGPEADAGALAASARDGLENLARTLSVEWARYGITVTMIAPGARTTEEELAGLVSFLLSRAGDYFTGCRFELGTVTSAP